MLTNFLIKWFGPSFRTTITGFLEAAAYTLGSLAVAPFTLGEVAMIVPPAMKSTLFVLALLCYIPAKILNAVWSKSSNVSGTPTSGQTVDMRSGETKVIPPADEKKES